MRVCAIVVTHNRRQMLARCIEALLAQEYRDFDILVVDNASTDGTEETVAKYPVSYLNTGVNCGGSGGFYSGIKRAYEAGYDYMWIMDDDVIPTPTALGELIGHLQYAPEASFLASAVYAEDETALNTPEVSRYSTNGYRFWYDKLECGMMRIEHATFVSLLICREAVERCGLPCKDYFIWGDDIEYTRRLQGYGASYMVGASKVYHLRKSARALDIFTENNPGRILFYYYLIRNTLVNLREYDGKRASKALIRHYRKMQLKMLLKRTPHSRLKRRVIRSAIRDFKRGRYNVGAFNERRRLYGQETAVVTFMGLKGVADELGKTYGYTVKSAHDKASLLTCFGHVPAAVAEREYAGASEITIDELRRAAKLKPAPILPNGYLVANVGDSTGRLGIFTRGEERFAVNYTSEFERDYKSGKLGPIKDNYALEVREATEEEFDAAAKQFALEASKAFLPCNVILAVDGSARAQDFAEKIRHRLPQCKIFEAGQGDALEQIKSLLGK